MKNDSRWRKFEKSGSVYDYLEYACTCEEDMEVSACNRAENERAANISIKGIDEMELDG